MKKILIILLALMPIMAQAQELTISDNGSIFMMGTKETDMTQEEVLNYILAYDILDDVVVHQNMIAGNIKPSYLNYQAEGYTRMKVPLYLSNGRFAARIIFRFKENRYRYEVLNLRFVDTQSSMPGTTYLSEVADAFGFDISCKLILKHINTLTTFYQTDEEWR